mmetsp:Transcript_6413/g.20470  ORF Transcript_6413/g.20470 Transcript_6413/m.20470 type:complete len:253 (+) Transcript_6413:432-1190(+)
MPRLATSGRRPSTPSLPDVQPVRASVRPPLRRLRALHRRREELGQQACLCVHHPDGIRGSAHNPRVGPRRPHHGLLARDRRRRGRRRHRRRVACLVRRGRGGEGLEARRRPRCVAPPAAAAPQALGSCVPRQRAPAPLLSTRRRITPSDDPGARCGGRASQTRSRWAGRRTQPAGSASRSAQGPRDQGRRRCVRAALRLGSSLGCRASGQSTPSARRGRLREPGRWRGRATPPPSEHTRACPCRSSAAVATS